MHVRRLHVGCGQHRLAGWHNVDSQPLPGVDQVIDVRAGIPLQNLEAIFAEHFLEHLTLDDGLVFLKNCRGALSPGGVLRLSTPNLDWVYETQYYHYKKGFPAAQDLVDCVGMNRAFHAWGHQFLYNRAMLGAALLAAGFATLIDCRYRESEVDFLRNIERHEAYPDTAELPHVLIVEARDLGPEVALPEELAGGLRRDLAAR